MLARIRPRNISAASAAPRSATIITSLARICSATRKRRHGARIIVACSNGDQTQKIAGLVMHKRTFAGFHRILAAAFGCLIKATLFVDHGLFVEFAPFQPSF